MNYSRFHDTRLRVHQEVLSLKSEGSLVKPMPTQRHFPTWRRSKKRCIFYLPIGLTGLVVSMWWFADFWSKVTLIVKRNTSMQLGIFHEKALSRQDLTSKPRYLSYLPHSGFHNQRISLENALTLAQVLNRTLILPPCLLGTAIPWTRFDQLLKKLKAIGSIRVEDCGSEDEKQLINSKECLSQLKGIWFDWSQLINLAQIEKSVQILKRESFEQEWLIKTLDIRKPEDEILQIKEEALYHYRFILRRQQNSSRAQQTEIPLGKFMESIDVYEQLDKASARLIELGSVFGSGRLRFSNDPIGSQARSNFRRATAFNNPILEELSKQIASQLYHPAGFLGVHIRMGDGIFKTQVNQTVSLIIKRLFTDHLKLSMNSYNQANLQSIDNSYRNNIGNLSSSIKAPLPCRGQKYRDTTFFELNRPLYMATDSPNPEMEPALDIIFKIFPCTYLLQDFDLDLIHQIKPTHHQQDISHERMVSLMVPFLDAMVAARASHALGTPGSTFSAFVTDILFPSYHNLSIIEVI